MTEEAVVTSEKTKRTSPRYQISLPATITKEGQQIDHSSLKNISLGGMLCLVLEKLSLDDKVKVAIRLVEDSKNGSSREIFLDATVVRVETDEEMGDREKRKTAFQFSNVDSNSINLLHAYLDGEYEKGNAKSI